MHLLVGGFVALPITAALAQNPAPPPALANWTGAIRCALQSQAIGYAHQEVQTWTLTGAPTVQGSVTVYPATWSVTGQGWHDRSRYTARRVARWTVNVPGPNAPRLASIGFQLHPVGGGFDVARRNAQLTTGGGYTGPDQFINDGVPQPPSRLVATLYEWQFPKIEASSPQTQLTGTSTAEVKAFVGPLQPPEAQSTVTCTWALGRGSAPPLPPPTLSPLSPPASIAQGATPTVAGGSPPAGGATSSTQSMQAAAAVTTTTPPTPTTVSQGSGIIPAPTSTVTTTTSTTVGAPGVQSGSTVAVSGTTLSTVATSGTTPTNLGATRGAMAVPPSPPICSAATTGSSPVITSVPQRVGMPSILPSQPAPTPTCVTVAQRLLDLQGYLAATLASYQASLVSSVAAPTALGTAAACMARIADVDAMVASLLQAMQAEYATLLAAAPTAADKTAVSKAQADATAQLRAWRDSVVAPIDKICQQLK